MRIDTCSLLTLREINTTNLCFKIQIDNLLKRIIQE